MAKIEVTDPKTGLAASTVGLADGEVPALAVATRELKTLTNSGGFFTNAEEGADMNKDASTGGTPENVHNGLDNTYWTGSNITGASVTFNNSAQANGGTQSVYVNAPAVNDVWQFAKGSDLTVSNYSSVTMAIRVDRRWSAGDSVTVYGWDTGLGVQVGNALALEGYFSSGIFDVWHDLSIPIDDFGIGASTIDALRVEYAAQSGPSVEFWMDDIVFQETGTPIKYSVKAPKGGWLHIDYVAFSIARTVNGSLADATMPKLPYNNFLGTSLSPGLTYQRTDSEGVVFSFSIASLMDIVQFGQAELMYGDNGTNVWMVVTSRPAEPFVLKDEDDDELSYTISEDLSGFAQIRVAYGGRLEQRT